MADEEVAVDDALLGSCGKEESARPIAQRAAMHKQTHRRKCVKAERSRVAVLAVVCPNGRIVCCQTLAAYGA